MGAPPAIAGHDMIWASSVSRRLAAEQALDEALAGVAGQLPAPPALVLLFVTPHHLPAFERLSRRLRARFPGARLLGCTGAGVIGGAREAERQEAVSLTAAVLPGVVVGPLRLPGGRTPDAAWARQLGRSSPDHTLLLVEPFSCDVEAVIEVLAAHMPRAVHLGGLVSGADRPGGSVLLLDDRIYDDGLVGVTLSGALEVYPIVAQAGRPVGEPMIATRVKDHVVYELSAGPPAEVLQRIYGSLSPQDQHLCHTSLLLGVEHSDQRGPYRPDDFLISDVLGMDPRSGAMAVGRRIQGYQVVQFHLRDADTAERALRRQLAALPSDARERVRGAAMFSCVGRGEGLFGRPHHDTSLVRAYLNGIPVAGLFSSGEIGPWAGRSRLHGFTTTLGLYASKRC